ncbi:DUF887-domain-containing protein [Rickenella mellea]|uniref:DUF887-domain-containing protein n=1 Tax=Rickenella mellea TaxID=50990 RepID=A0A4Y7QDU2_9AGAM|nr:DUF887-domain-containing protein [Rickenella mellea]
MWLASLHTAIQDASIPVANELGLSRLPAYADVVLASALGFWFTHLALAPFVSRMFVGGTYDRLGRGRNNWCVANVHVVSMAHALLVTPLAFRALSSRALDADRAFGWDDKAGTAMAVACGYFLWDTVESIVHFSDVGFVVHGLSCFLIYLLSFRPFIAYYGPRFLLWELSTPFLNIHWFLDKMGKTGSRIQLVNGALLLVVFTGVRLVYGNIMSYNFFLTMYAIREEVSTLQVVVYCGGNVVLNTLNIVWFFKMIAALRKRMQPARVTEGNGVYVNGRIETNGNAKLKDQ